jgi:ABC-2 type transport system permease protein
LTLTTPGSPRHDVRGRQLAWLLLVGPAALLLTLLLTALSRQTWALPWALALVAAGLGAGAGLVVLNSVFRLIPMTDPHLRGDDLLEHGFDPGQFLLLLLLAALLVAPALAVVFLGNAQNLDWLRWAGIPVGLGTGFIYSWWFGRLAYRQLEARGPDLLHLMRSGEIYKPAVRNKLERPGVELPRGKTALISLLVLAGCILLFPQGIVPLIFKLIGSEAKLWFLPLYLPEEIQWLAIAGTISLALIMFAAAWSIYSRHKKSTSSGTSKEGIS